jgi:serine protease AprX
VLLTSTGSLDGLAADVALAGGRVVQTYAIARTLLAELPESVSAPQGSFVVPNVAMKFNSAPATAVSDGTNTFKATIGAPESGGSGVKVAVVDTGVDSDANITVSDRVNVSGDVAGDGYGHGTFMAGLVAGDDADFGGVAPNASIVDVQVAAADGSTDLARVLAGLQAVADLRDTDPSVDVLMLALSAQSPLPPHIDPLTVALNRLWDAGLTVVVASGNDGAGSVTTPATDPTLLVVGAQDELDTAVRSDDVVADFSSYGRAFGFMRPDVVAPGVSLISSSPTGSIAYTQNVASQVAPGYLKGTGTSMSAAVTAGAVAVLLAKRPELTPDQAKALVVGTAYRTEALTRANGAGAGGLNLRGALRTDLDSVDLPPTTPAPGQYGPSEEDAAVWADFAQAWAKGDIRAVAAAWAKLSPQTRKWAANAWSLQSLVRALQSDGNTWDGRRWAGRRWAIEDWDGRRWASDEWVGRRWADAEWLETVWDGRRWAGRRWAGEDWLAFAWTLRVKANDDSIEEMWDSESWEGRRWADLNWVGRRWAFDAWSGRRWADFAWDGRRWAEATWDGRRWADFAFEGRRWATSTWDGRRWAFQSW